MPTLNDARFDALVVLVPLAPRTTNDMLFAWLATEGGTGDTLVDRWMSMLEGKVGVTVDKHRSDMWFQLLGINGYTQATLKDREFAFWVAGGALV